MVSAAFTDGEQTPALFFMHCTSHSVQTAPQHLVRAACSQQYPCFCFISVLHTERTMEMCVPVSASSLSAPGNRSLSQNWSLKRSAHLQRPGKAEIQNSTQCQHNVSPQRQQLNKHKLRFLRHQQTQTKSAFPRSKGPGKLQGWPRVPFCRETSPSRLKSCPLTSSPTAGFHISPLPSQQQRC